MPPEFKHFDQAVADAFVDVHKAQTGLPRFLGLRVDEVTAGAWSCRSTTKRTAVVRVEVSNDGRPVCAAQGTVLIQEPKPGS